MRENGFVSFCVYEVERETDPRAQTVLVFNTCLLCNKPKRMSRARARKSR